MPPPDPTRPDVVALCPDCGKTFPLVFNEYGRKHGGTLDIGYCLSAGVYSVEVVCPHCGGRTDVLAYG
jgi:predicted RNA-binding Zn-ribbon protein involved in translation (DUF1610 family)